MRGTSHGSWLALALGLLASGSAAAEDAPQRSGPAAPAVAHAPHVRQTPTPSDVAARVAAAHRANDVELLRSAAAGDAPSPWLVVDELEGQGAGDAAMAFAAARGDETGQRLRAYLANGPRAPAERARVALRTSASVDGGDVATPLPTFSGDEAPPPNSILAMRCTDELARRAGLRDDASAVLAALESSARCAVAIGWWEAELARLDRAARVAFGLHAYERARTHFESAASLADQHALRREHADARSNLGSVAAECGDLPGAQRHFEAAQAAYRALGDSVNEFDVTSKLGAVLTDAGDFARGLLLQTQARDSLHRIAPNSESYGDSLVRIGDLYFALSDEGRMLDAYRVAVRWMEAHGDDEGKAMANGNLAIALHLAHRDDDADAHLGRAAELFTSAESERGVLWVQAVRAHMDTDRGRLVEARTGHERTLAAYEKLGWSVDRVYALSGLAWTETKAGDLGRAIAVYSRGLEEAERIRSTYGTTALRAGLTIAQRKARRLHESLRSASLLLREQDLVAVDVKDPSATTDGSRVVEAFEAGMWCAIELGDVRALQQLAEGLRAHELCAALGGRERLRSAAVPPALAAAETTARAVELEALERYRDTVSGGESLAELKRRRDEHDDARRRTQDVWARVQAETRVKDLAGLLTPLRIDIDGLRSRLQAEEAWVYYLRVEDEYCALVVLPRAASPADGVRVVSLCRVSALRSAAEEFHPADAAVDPEPAARALKATLIDRLGVPSTTKRLLICPDALAARIPFTVLDPTREFAFEPSATTYDLLCEHRRRSGVGVLAVGDPDYSVDASPALSTARRGPGFRLTPLPATRFEATSVAAIAGGEALVGRDATIARLEAALRERSGRRLASIHLACHGLIDSRRPELSALALSAEPGDDGLLTTLRVLRLRANADLVVLSACNTGTDRFYDREGVSGLVRALFFAGSPRVVASLWPVDDSRTRTLMVDFHERLHRPSDVPSSTAGALREAQGHVRDSTPHPRYWGAWVLWGLPN